MMPEDGDFTDFCINFKRQLMAIKKETLGKPEAYNIAFSPGHKINWPRVIGC